MISCSDEGSGSYRLGVEVAVIRRSLLARRIRRPKRSWSKAGMSFEIKYKLAADTDALCKSAGLRPLQIRNQHLLGGATKSLGRSRQFEISSSFPGDRKPFGFWRGQVKGGIPTNLECTLKLIRYADALLLPLRSVNQMNDGPGKRVSLTFRRGYAGIDLP